MKRGNLSLGARALIDYRRGATVDGEPTRLAMVGAMLEAEFFVRQIASKTPSK